MLRRYYPTLEFVEQGLWIRIPDYPMPPEMLWNREKTDVAFSIPAAYPGANPYGIYVLEGLTYNGAPPNGSYKCPADQQPPFTGRWGMFSWGPEEWRPTSDVLTGPNLLNFVRSFARRFQEGP